MNYAQIKQRYFCGVDLHANSMYIKILDREGQVLYKRNMPNNMALFKKILNPFLPDVAVGVESTFNYYWLYDGCVEADIPFYLGHAAYMKAIAGNKQKNDPLNAETIAHLMRSNLFPQAPTPIQEKCGPYVISYGVGTVWCVIAVKLTHIFNCYYASKASVTFVIKM